MYRPPALALSRVLAVSRLHDFDGCELRGAEHPKDGQVGTGHRPFQGGGAVDRSAALMFSASGLGSTTAKWAWPIYLLVYSRRLVFDLRRFLPETFGLCRVRGFARSPDVIGRRPLTRGLLQLPATSALGVHIEG